MKLFILLCFISFIWLTESMLIEDLWGRSKANNDKLGIFQTVTDTTKSLANNASKNVGKTLKKVSSPGSNGPSANTQETNSLSTLTKTSATPVEMIKNIAGQKTVASGFGNFMEKINPKNNSFFKWMEKSTSNMFANAISTIDKINNNIDLLFENTIDAAKEKLGVPSKKAEECLENLRKTGIAFIDEFINKIEVAMDKANATIVALLKKAESYNVNVTSCTSLFDQVIVYGSKSISNFKKCIDERINVGKHLFNHVVKISKEIVDSFLEIRDKYSACHSRAEGFLTSACFYKARLKAAWAISRKLPTVAYDISQLATLRVSMTACGSISITTAISSYSHTILNQINKCFKKSIALAKSDETDNEDLDSREQLRSILKL